MEEMEARLAKVRPAMRNMLKGNPNVFPYTTFTTADKFFTRHPMWQQAKIEQSARVFEEYVAELRLRELVCTVPKLSHHCVISKSHAPFALAASTRSWLCSRN